MSRKKSSGYKIDELITEYNKDLYDEIISQTKIILIKDFKNGWTAKLKNGEAQISYKYTDYPDAAFAHELLHIKYELNGLKMPFVIDPKGIGSSIPYIFNQLCHHKFYEEFISLGFENEEFLNDSDENDISTLMKRDMPNIKELFSKHGKLDGSLLLLLPYIALKSPHDQSEKTQNFIDELKKYGKEDFFLEIDTILRDWKNDTSLDSSKTFARIFKATNNLNIGFSLTKDLNNVIVSATV